MAANSFKVFHYRIYPSKAQLARLESTLELARRFYNNCLAERNRAYQAEGRVVSLTEQLRTVKLYKAELDQQVHSHVLQVVAADLDKAFAAFFRRVKSGEKPGCPRFKGVGRFHSFGLKEPGNGFKIDGRRLRLFGIGRIAVRWHRSLEGEIKTLRIVRKVGKWYACFCCRVQPSQLPPTHQEVGIDAGLTTLFTLSTGEGIENPRWYRLAEPRLRVLQRRVNRRKLGGSNRQKAAMATARLGGHITNCRKDFLNKLVNEIVQRFDRIAFEDLSISRMVHGNLAKSILDAGWGYFGRRLTHKAESAGRVATPVEPAFTSQDCCQCGERHCLSLSDRWFTCACGNSRSRDDNAAQNILARGQRVWAASSATAGLAQEAVLLK